MINISYYVKSAGKLYGPFTFDQVAKCITKDIFNGRDKISGDKINWQEIRSFCNSDDVSSEDASLKEKFRTADSFDEDADLDDFMQGKFYSGFASGLINKIASHLRYVVISLSIFFVLLISGIGTYFYVGTRGPRNFQEVCQQYQSAVGLVVVVLEDENGKLLNTNEGLRVRSDYPIGTAFAIAPNKFVTNCHVAYGVKDQKEQLLKNILAYNVVTAAIENGAKNEEQVMEYFKKNEETVNKCYELLSGKVRIRNVEIRLAHSNGRFFTATGVQAHPRYQSNSEEYKNSEYDVAIFTTKQKTDVFFESASEKDLYKLASGQEIAYLGFPMEGLLENGNLDIDKPEAVLKSGTISKITDFNNVFSTPDRNRSIIHDIPTAGGSSGSPVFRPDGKIVAILWGCSNIGLDKNGARISSAIQHNYALRIDALDAVREQKIVPMEKWTNSKEN